MLRCKEEGNKPSTMNNKLRSIKVFFNYLVEEEIIEKTLQKILRHEDITMTQRYVNLWGTALKQQNDKYNPLNNIDIG
ncbi:site-specific recombinase XerD [Bacillus fengqiuensis]|nr:site-specific recombinase XerD [Bacillus fengqiuensis]